ncbi:hypothetical protein NBRC10512_000767 [Rhodotorula toruloides]|uniref:RHTO0S04e06018g1_1 n=2 Tax=Rhodotorula toruloides TaxID=5286 RepID=A0A061AVZ7_RHOTO|nr:uncharacterized protein RHTO_02016 [Rhodotorula toruloides NP11]EMS21145.1 hypothetical protein RHTO_02016 [Rhodotorula toruloides NP11]CDR39522.1 RHTO0S04e06018g1_1 [Rhodotorula toruloides]
MSDTAGKKRAASEDFDSSAADARPPPNLRSGPFVPPDDAEEPSPANEVVRKAEGWIEKFESKVDADEHVVLQTGEAKGLVEDLRNLVAGFRSSPATKDDIADVLDRLDEIYHYVVPTKRLPYSPPQHQSLPLRLPAYGLRASPPQQPSIFQQLPFDVLRLVMLELRHLHETEAGKRGLTDWRINDWQRTVRGLRRVSANMKEVCDAICKAELAVTAVEDLPRIAARMTRTPQYAEDLRRLEIYLRDLDQLGNRSGTDAAFSLPDVIRLSHNVTALNLAGDSIDPDFSESLRFYLSRRGYSFDEMTGGVSVPDTIVALPYLRHLSYGAPCSVADIVKFITEIPTLTSLDIRGLVDHDANPEIRPASASLRRLWMPGVAVPPTVLARLLGISPPTEQRQDDDDGIPRPQLRSLAFTFDPENTVPHTGANVEAEIDALLNLFGIIGPRLVELHLSLPGADENGSLSFLGPLAAILPLPLPGGAGAQPGPAGGAGGPAMAAPQNVQGAGAAAGPWNTAAAQQRGVLARRGAGTNRTAGLPPVRTHQAAAAAAAGAAQAPQNGPHVPHPNRQPPAVGAGGGAAPAGPAPQPQAGAGGAGGGRANLNQLFAVRAVRPEHFFFAELLQHCPNLEHLELYGRRYNAGLVDVLRTLPLRHLALSVPNNEERAPFVEGLLKALEEGVWPNLRRLELSGRGGDWAPSERRQVKDAAEKRPMLEYRSTDLKR